MSVCTCLRQGTLYIDTHGRSWIADPCAIPPTLPVAPSATVPSREAKVPTCQRRKPPHPHIPKTEHRRRHVHFDDHPDMKHKTGQNHDKRGISRNIDGLQLHEHGSPFKRLKPDATISQADRKHRRFCYQHAFMNAPGKQTLLPRGYHQHLMLDRAFLERSVKSNHLRRAVYQAQVNGDSVGKDMSKHGFSSGSEVSSLSLPSITPSSLTSTLSSGSVLSSSSKRSPSLPPSSTSETRECPHKNQDLQAVGHRYASQSFTTSASSQSSSHTGNSHSWVRQGTYIGAQSFDKQAGSSKFACLNKRKKSSGWLRCFGLRK